MTPQHVACSLRLMAIWHAYFVLDIRFDNQIDLKELRTLGRYVSKYSSEKVRWYGFWPDFGRINY